MQAVEQVVAAAVAEGATGCADGVPSLLGKVQVKPITYSNSILFYIVLSTCLKSTPQISSCMSYSGKPVLMLQKNLREAQLFISF